MSVTVRRCVPADAGATLAVFRRAVHVTAAADYSPEQLEAWAPHGLDADRWASRQSQRNAAVAVVGERVVGFTDVDATGYVDMMFVDPDHARRGVATALMAWVQEEAVRLGARRLTTHASETARRFFEAHGFRVDARRTFPVRGVTMTNYAMSAVLGDS
ncbi:GNAT family N-acetyltransferase [Actinotalea sp. C106]|uniref:GNAT family N-acetyltransferase n=1 Tax=Actinotalea sp. C106 TaxID=2908644 RepID=UPI002027BB6D|nr:GNAT family N-acetyltransferase [Actinotalea sp. C106]